MPRLPKWRMTQTAFLRFLMAIVIVAVYAYMSRAQEPAADQLTEDVFVSEESDVVASSPQAIQAILNSINGRNPETPADFMHAVITLRRMGAYSDAQSFLDKAVAANMDRAGMVELHKNIGTAELVKLSVDTNLPEARELVFSIFNAVKLAKRNRETLLSQVGRLSSPDEEAQRVAMAELAEAGSHAVPALVENVLSKDSKVTHDQINAAIFRIGEAAEEPLLALLGSPNPTLQAMAANGLARIGTDRTHLPLIRPYFNGDAATRAAATAAFRASKVAPSSPQQSATVLNRLATSYLNGKPPRRANFEGNIEMWTWSTEENNVVPYTLGVPQASAVAAARSARDAYELDPTNENGLLLLVSRLHVDQLLGGVDEPLTRGAGSAFQLGQQQIASPWSALDYALDNELDAAAIGALEVLSEQNRGSLAAGAKWTPLTRALQHPNRRVRFAAVKAIMKIDPRRQYAGASFFMEALIDLANAAGQQRAIVGMPRRDAAERLTSALAGLGFSVTEVSEARPLLKAAVASSDVDVVFLSDSVSYPTAHEAIQQLRKHPRTKRLPVVLLVRRDGMERAKRIAAIDELTTVLPEFASNEAVLAKIEEMEKSVRNYSVSPQRRIEQAKDAIGWFTHLAQYSQTYNWYDLQRANDVALVASNHPSLSTATIELLGYLGGDKAQQRLVDLASDASLKVEDRQRAATAFTESVNRRGLNLRSASVYRQYDRYNASEKDEVAIQEIMGQVLDAIESQTKPTSVSVPTFE